MKDIMKEVEGKVKFSMADSTMMLLVQQAMDKAHEKIKTKHGLLLRLNAISLFYELAVLQLETCLNFVQQETDNLESNHEEVVRDLRKIKDRLHHRLLETELAILEKDRELLERSENEASLRNVLESKETELVHLQDLERKRSSNEIGEEFFELKSSVDHQVMNLRQKLETEYDGLGKETEDPSGVDIDVLKGTMDLAFNKMHHAIFLSELGPIEQSWRWSIERDTMGLLIKGFMSGLEEEKKKVMMVVKDYELGFKDRVCLIRREVECLESQIFIHISSSSPRAITTSSTPSIDCEVVNDEKEEENEQEGEDSSNYPVSKLIKSHESIIRRKSEELVPPKIESIKRQRSCNSSSSKRALDDIVAGLDSLMCLNTRMFEHFVYDKDDERCDDHEVVMDYGLDDVWKKMHKHKSVLSESKVEEKEYVEMELIMILEDTYLTLLKGLLIDENIKSRKTQEDEIKSQEKDLEILHEDEDFRQEVGWIVVGEFLREVSESAKNQERIEADSKRLLEDQGKRACLDTSLVFDGYEILREDEEFRQEVDWIVVRELLREVSETVEIHERMEADNKRLLEEQRKRSCLDTSLVFDDFEILREDGEFRQEVDWIIVRELLREKLETQEKIEANNKRLLEEEVKRACMEISLVFDDFDFKIQKKIKNAILGLQHLDEHIDSTVNYIAELRQKESVYRTAFVLRSENLIKAETEVDLLGDQVDSLVNLLQKTLWTFHQHPSLLCNHSDISEICKMIEEVLYEDHKPN
ncbi:WPP domain associated protein [Hirschfeldia incana]|nr:WPP domain associated protein [Hirschfeldia incana]